MAMRIPKHWEVSKAVFSGNFTALANTSENKKAWILMKDFMNPGNHWKRTQVKESK